MIGNDVVDILIARKESNWERKGFREKLFTHHEQQLISSFADPELMVWTLWSMKEAAYKIYSRKNKVRTYIPHKLECIVINWKDNGCTGKVFCNNEIYFTKTVFEDYIIHTVAVYNKNQLKNVHEVNDCIIIKDNFGLPYINTENIIKPVSIAHHGRCRKIVNLK